jgi:6-phosphofructo-2-kinase
MPLLEGTRDAYPPAGAASTPVRRQSQLSDMAKSAIISSAGSSGTDDAPSFDHNELSYKPSTLMGPPKPVASRNVVNQLHKESKPAPSQHFLNPAHSIGQALTDTPISTAPSSPQMQVPDS